MLARLQKLCETAAPSGAEGALAKLIEEEIRPFADEIYQDALGNLIAHKKGDGKRLMFAAHMDEIGLTATCYGEKGQIYVSALGGINPHAALYQHVRFTGGAKGVLVPDGKQADLIKTLKTGDMYVDVGAGSEEEAQKLVALGETAVFDGAFYKQGDVVVSKALDNRAGCCVLIEAMRRIQHHSNDLYFVFTVSEELGLRGAKAAAVSVKPDFAVAIDVTRTGDTPSGGKMAVKLGQGVAVKIMDSSFLAHPIIKTAMQAVCKDQNIPFQPEVLERGGTDAGAIHLTGGGVPSGCISIPTRYIHTPCEMIHQSDLEAAAALATALIERGL